MRAGLGAIAVTSVAAASVLIACSLFADTDGLTNGNDDDARTLDGSSASDANGSDASASSDGGVDGASACAVTFCDDFDDGPLGSTWTSSNITAGASAALGSEAHSEPSALRAAISDAGVKSPQALLKRELGTGRGARCDFWVKMLGAPGSVSDFVDVFSVQAMSGGTRAELWLGTGATVGTLREDLFLDDGGCACPITSKSPPPLPVGKWTHVVYETTFTTQSLALDDVVVTSGALAGSAPSGPISVVVGIRGAASAPGVALLDDVACELLK